MIFFAIFYVTTKHKKIIFLSIFFLDTFREPSITLGKGNDELGELKNFENDAYIIIIYTSIYDLLNFENKIKTSLSVKQLDYSSNFNFHSLISLQLQV